MTKTPKQSAFPDTRWSLLRRVRDDVDNVHQDALQQVLTIYYPIMIIHIVRRFHLPRHTAEDLVHDFISEKILAKGILARADPEIGRFRGYLARILGNFVISKIRIENRYRNEPIDDAAIDRIADEADASELSFDRDWADHILNSALASMEAECTRNARQDIWQILKFRIVDSMLNDTAPLPYDKLVQLLDLRTPRQAINLLATAKRVFERHIRKQLGSYTEDSAELDQMFDDFCSILLK
jgi:RNA polymerase sigma factor (sigma-70 family)